MKKIYRDEKGRFCKRHNSVEKKAQVKKWRKDNVVHIQDYGKKYNQRPEVKARAKTPERVAYRREFYRTPKQKTKKKIYAIDYNQRPEVKEWYRLRNSIPEYKALQVIWKRDYRQDPKNKGRIRAQWAKNRARRLQRYIPLIETNESIVENIYANCPEGWHVDHIVPLLGETISGLHVPENLQYLPDWVNHMKGNLWEDSWAEHTIDTPLEEKIEAYSLARNKRRKVT